MSKLDSLERAFRAEGGDTLIGAPVDVEQLELLRDPATGRLPANVFQIARAQGRVGAGRPKGVGNKRNVTLAKLICNQFGDPVMAMASIYARPIDQLIELILVADSTAEREQRLLDLVDRTEDLVKAALRDPLLLLSDRKLEQLTGLLDRVLDAAKALKMKPGDLAIKAINLQLTAARAVAEYVHSKKPVEANLNISSSGVIVMPPPQPSAGAGSPDVIKLASEKISDMLANGRIEISQLADLRMENGLLVDAEWEEAGDGEIDGDGDDDGAG
jgi:hypothetical protein